MQKRRERNLGKRKNEKEIKGILEENGKRKWRKEKEDGGRGIKGANRRKERCRREEKRVRGEVNLVNPKQSFSE